MSGIERISYKPAPTIKAFIRDYRRGELFYNWIVGPYGSGKTSGMFFKLIHMAGLQEPDAQGVRRTRAVVVRNTAPQLKDTTLASWGLWFKDGQAGDWHATEKNFDLKFGLPDGTRVECEVLFRPLDTPDDVARVLSLEVTFALIDEFVQLPRAIIDALSARVGRFPPSKDGGATNFGMWGASNPDTEDSWWFDFLHNNRTIEYVKGGKPEDPDVRRLRRAMSGWDIDDVDEPTNATYYIQPSALGPDAENLENLRGGRKYYANLVIGKSKAWIKQFAEAEWGYSSAGQPVIATFKQDTHISSVPLRFNPMLPLVIGFDPGLAGSAFVFGQLTFDGVLNVLGELVQQGYGTERLISERLKPYLKLKFPNFTRLVIAPDPAAANRTPTDEGTVVRVVRKHFGRDAVKIETNNRLPLRIDAIEYYSTKLLEVGPALQIDPKECPILIRALKGGWRWEMKPKKEALKKEVEDNAYTHVGDALGYTARFFYKEGERQGQYGAPQGRKFVPPTNFGGAYHAQ